MGNTAVMEWYDPYDPVTPYGSATIDADVLYAPSPTLSLQAGRLYESEWLFAGEFSYTRIPSGDEVDVPGFGTIPLDAEPLHLLAIAARLGYNVLGSNLDRSKWAAFVGLAGHLGSLSESFPYTSGGGVYALSVFVSAEDVVRRRERKTSFVTLAPIISYPVATHNWPKFLQFGVRVNFYHR